MLLEEVRNYWESLSYCGCYDQRIQDILKQATEAYYFIESKRDGEEGWTVVQCPDGVWTISESQDYTGHGCRCGSSIGAAETGPFPDLSTAIRLGLTREARNLLKL